MRDINCKAMVKELEKRMKLKIAVQFSTIHNYIDLNKHQQKHDRRVTLRL